MFCAKCGAKIGNGNFCGCCGTPVEAPKEKSKKGPLIAMLAMIGATALAAVLFVILLVQPKEQGDELYGCESYEELPQAYWEAEVNIDGPSTLDYYHEAILRAKLAELQRDSSGYDDMTYESFMETMREDEVLSAFRGRMNHGGRVTVSTQIVEDERCDSEWIEDVEQRCRSEGQVLDITQARELTFEVEFSTGDVRTDEMTVIEVDGRWYIYSYTG